MSNPDDKNPQSPWPVYGQAQGGSSSSTPQPWPVYGQPSAAGQPPLPASSGQQAQPQYGAVSGNPYGHQPPSNPYGTQPGQQPLPGSYGQPAPGPAADPGPFTAPGAYGMQPQGGPFGSPGYMQPPVPAQPLPSRTGPIMTIVLGVVLMVVIAPVVLFAVLLSGVGISQVVEQSVNAQNGGVVVVDETGSLGIMPTSGVMNTCEVIDSSGTATPMQPEVDGAIQVVRGLTPGEYTVQCSGLGSTDMLVVLDGNTLERIAPATTRAFGWASVVGVAGVATVIGGIVWLVKRNGARRAIAQGHRL